MDNEQFEAELLEDEEPAAEVIDTDCQGEGQMEPALVLGDDDPRDAGLHEQILSEEQAWRGRMLDVRTAEVRLPNGRVTGRDLVRHPGAAAVVALTESGKIVLVRQYRTAIDRVTVEIPAGKLDPGEDPLECAKRELLEETGFKAGRINYLTTIATTPGFCDELIHIYMATGLTFAGANPDDDEFVNVDLVPLSELIDAVLDGKIEDAKTVIGALACDAISHRL
ncbi:MAG: NUDIX hydrolase [Coriobacteriaceae bacterium]|nr:NUDIX hydrolase [Coriobacteriaceae bacterium]